MKRLALALLLAACTDHHHVQLLLGSSETSPSAGFLCAHGGSGANAGDPLMADARVGDRLQFALAVDVIDLGGSLPSCFADDISAACRGGRCEARADLRTCLDVDAPLEGVTSAPAVAAQIETWLQANAPPLLADAPHTPVMVRITAFRNATVPIGTPDPAPCTTPASNVELLGCAYSCPVVLDDVDGALQVGLETQDDIGADPAVCQKAIAVCATFPGDL